jgi:hypothetical protein
MVKKTKTKSKTTQEKTALKTVHSKEMRALVNSSLAEMDAMTAALTDAGVSKEEAELKVQQLYFKNLKMSGEPAAMMQKSLAELATRIELDRIINPDADLVSDKAITLIETQMKAIKMLHSMNKVSNVVVHRADDRDMKFTTFIDVEEEN